MAGPYASLQFSDPDLAYKQKLQQGEATRKQVAAEQRNIMLQNQQDRATNNTLQAQQLALGQARGMSANQDNPRSVTGTTMTIQSGQDGEAGFGGGSNASRKLPTGGFGTTIPQIDGRYMSLVQYQQPTITDPDTTPQVQLGAGDFTPEDATAYQNAAFARLKDKSGALGQGAVQSLAAQLAGRGISGQSGTFGRGLVEKITQAVNPLADLNVAHLGEEYNAAARARQMSEARAQAAYSGGIQQRGQDIASQQAMNNLMAQIAQLKYQGEISQRENDLERLYRMF